MGYLLRMHPSQDSRLADKELDKRTLEAWTRIVDIPLTPTAISVARLPLLRGGLGLRSQEAISAFAHTSADKKGAQAEHQNTVDNEVQDGLKTQLNEHDVLLLRANCSPGAIRALADPAVVLSGDATRTLLRQRLMLPVLPGVTSVCGSPATNDYVRTCSRIPGGMRIARHNPFVTTIATWARELGFESKTEPRTDTTSKTRLDLIVTTPSMLNATDLIVTYAGRPPNGYPAAIDGAHQGKLIKWATWVHVSCCTFMPLTRTPPVSCTQQT